MRNRDLEKLSREELINLVQLYSKDPLTGLRGRRDFELKFEEMFEDHDCEFYLTMLDINGLHNMNKISYDMGDSLIRKVVEYLKYYCQGTGELFRLGGDEFVIISKDLQKDCKQTKNFCMSNVYSEDFCTSGEMFSAADRMVLDAKAEFYKNNGNNRRL